MHYLFNPLDSKVSSPHFTDEDTEAGKVTLFVVAQITGLDIPGFTYSDVAEFQSPYS
jgi:hypothetical protein